MRSTYQNSDQKLSQLSRSYFKISKAWTTDKMFYNYQKKNWLKGQKLDQQIKYFNQTKAILKDQQIKS